MNKKLAFMIIVTIFLVPTTWVWADSSVKPTQFGIYSNRYINTNLSFDEDVALSVWQNTGELGELSDDSNLEGPYMRLGYPKERKGWFGIGYAVLPEGNFIDMSKFANGHLCVSLKSSGFVPKKLMIGIKSGNTNYGESWIKNLSLYGFNNDGKWHNLRIPIADFVKNNTNFFKLNQISQYFMLVGKNVTDSGMIDFDEIYWDLQ